MAIYKPSNCTPFLGSLDLSEDQDIQCELNTSNNQVVGYKIKITDAQNNVILDDSEYTSLDDHSLEKYNNQCLNGTFLTLPLVVSSPEYVNKNNIFSAGYNWIDWKPDYNTLTDDGTYAFLGQQYLRISSQTVTSGVYNDLENTDIFKKVNGFFRDLHVLDLEPPLWSDIDKYDYYYLAGTQNGYTKIFKTLTSLENNGAVVTEKDYQNIKNGIYEYNSGSKFMPTKREAINDNVYYKGYTIINSNTINEEKYSLVDVYKMSISYESVAEKPSLKSDAVLDELYYNEHYTQFINKPIYSFAYLRCYYKDDNGDMQLIDGNISSEDYNDISVVYDKVVNYAAIDRLNRPNWDSSLANFYYSKDYYIFQNIKPSWESAQIEGNNYYYLTSENNFAKTSELPSEEAYDSIISVYQKDVLYNPLTSNKNNSLDGIFNYVPIANNTSYKNAPVIFEKIYISIGGVSDNFYNNNIDTLYKQNINTPTLVDPKPNMVDAAYNKYYFLDYEYKPVSIEYCQFPCEHLAVHDNGNFYVAIKEQNEGAAYRYANALCYASFDVVQNKPDTKSDAILRGYYYLSDDTSGLSDGYRKITYEMSDNMYRSLSNCYSFSGFQQFPAENGGSLNNLTAYKKIDNFYNGYQYQPYKWQINLMQGDIGEISISDVRSKWFDMQITRGTVIGSTPSRLQGLFSEEIYKNYWVQLYKKEQNNLTYVENSHRTLIKSYDGTFGYLYPQDGSISEENISEATHFAIFKYTNDPQYVSAGRNVNYLSSGNINAVMYNGNTPTANFSHESESAYYTQVYSGIITIDSVLISNYCPNGPSEKLNLGLGGTSFLFLNTGNNNLNGVFVLADLVVNATDSTTTFRWQRTPETDSYSDFINSALYVESEEANYILSNQKIGSIINNTPLIFEKERPIEIYPTINQEYSEYYNGITSSDDFVSLPTGKTISNYYSPLFKTNNTKTFIRPFIGIQSGMKFKYGETDLDSLIIDNIDTNIWAISHDPLPYGQSLKPDKTSYNIYSYYKIGDEIPFYAYKKPYISVNIENLTNGIDNATYPIIINRYVISDAIYVQEQNKSWKNFKWRLYDITNEMLVEETNNIYSGAFLNKFIGLENNIKYRLSIIIENELGYIQESYKDFILFANLETGSLPISIEQQCMSQSVDMSIIRVGLIEPTPSYSETFGFISYETGTEEEDNGSMVISDGISTGRDYAVKYSNVASGGGTISIEPPSGNNFRVISKHNIGEFYSGSVIKYLFNGYDGDVQQGDYRFVLNILVEPDTIKENDEIKINNNRFNLNVVFREEQYRSGNWTLVSEEQETEEYAWNHNNSQISFSLVKPGTQSEPNVNYLYTTIAYNADGTVRTGYYNLASSEYNPLIVSEENTKLKFSYLYNTNYNNYVPYNGKINFTPLYISKYIEDPDSIGCWFDEVMYSKYGSDVFGVLLTKREPAYWPDDSIEDELYWNDESYGFYNQKDINESRNHSGKELINNYDFIFDISVLNYNDYERTGEREFIINVYQDGQILIPINENS